MKLLRRAPREGVEQAGAYPEPAFITNRPRLRFWYRFLLGRPMDGQRWTNSTFWRSATRGEDHWWLRLAGWQRSLLRCSLLWSSLLTLPLTLLWLLGAESFVLTVLTYHLGAALTVLLPVLTYRLLRAHGMSIPLPERVLDAEQGSTWKWSTRTVLYGRRRWEQERLLPVAKVVSALVSRPYHPADAHRWVSIPRNYREQGAPPVEILLPVHFHATTERAQKQVVNAVAAKLGMKDPTYRYELEGNAPRLLLTAPVLPPAHVSFEDLLPTLTAAAPGNFVVGRAGAETLTVSLQQDSPHMALSAGSGAGKSEFIKQIIAQALHWGWFVIILDWKEESQEWADGLPGVRYVRSIEALHDMCVSIGDEVEWRKVHRQQERPNVLVVSEEWGVTAPLLAAYWTAYRATLEPEERRVTPVKSPAAEAMMKLNFTGRSMGLHQFLVAQRFSARVTNGNADLRESFTSIFMSRWKAQTLKMLAPDLRPIPKKLTKPGQWLAVTGDVAVVLQAGLWTDGEAKEWAMNGIPAPASPWAVRGNGPLSQHAETVSVQASTLGDVVATVGTGHNADRLELDGSAPPIILKKLSDISTDLDYLGITTSILRKAAREDGQGDPDFPPVRGGTQFSGYLYDLKEVTEWARRKRAREAAEAGR